MELIYKKETFGTCINLHPTLKWVYIKYNKHNNFIVIVKNMNLTTEILKQTDSYNKRMAFYSTILFSLYCELLFLVFNDCFTQIFIS